MAKEILKATDLFKIKGSYIIGGTKIETGVNEYSNNPQCFAMKRPAQSATAAAKITAVIRLFGRMNEISFYEAENSPLVMIESHGNFIQACLKSDRTIGIRSTFDCVKKDLWVAVAALAMAKSVRNLVSAGELEDIFISLVRTMTGGASSFLENTKLLSNLFCDIIYYYMIKDSQIELESGSLTTEEVKTAYNTGLLTTHSMFDLVPDSVKLQAEPSLQKEKPKTKKSSNGKEFLKNAKAGKFQIKYDWSDEQKMHIQPASFLDTFVSSQQFESLTKKIKHRLDKVLERQAEGVQYMDVIGNDYINALMVGKPGTGKTTLAYALSAATGLDGEGVAEFIDLDIEKALSAGARYAAFNVYNFSDENFSKMEHAAFGFMTRNDMKSGEIFEPSTVKQRMDLASATTTCIPVIFDLRERVLIWCDMALTADHVRAGYGGINVESNLPSVVVTCKAMVDVKKPNLYDLFTFNAKARGVITDNPDEADIRFGLDDNCDVKPSDIDVIVGKYL